ncbi:family 43 glycosylhydrolase [Niabella yanshanensis]|uniref:Family 43 glycosylhydrolase n=1 Tax=Niabella yanshanensis TaxID=577386 RepID=A0ABZ0W640_9BACT|nr:family 43 glycosylhydrolase [Niabella yanshanensis]WQD38009.1 family 43 glycosylhydrolase [Niabella yanshanensis]
MSKLKFFTCLLVLQFTYNHPALAQSKNIKNDIFWNTSDGTPIYSQGGGIFKFTDPVSGSLKYYWYGVHYKEAENYRQDHSVTYQRNNFVAVTCYTSSDLVNWKFESNVLTKAETDKHERTYWVGRLGVAYVKELKKYAMFVQHGNGVLITVSDSPNGPFVWHQKISMKEMIGTPNTGDQTVFTDDDGKSYLVYSYGQGRHKIYVSEIGVKDNMVNLLDCTKIFQGAGREGNCMFKYQGKYYMAASNLYGWDASLAYYLIADNVRGPYLPANDMKVMKGAEEDYAHITQTGFFVNVKGSKQETVIYCGDRWANFAGNGLGYNQWVPLSFKNDDLYFNSLNSWNLDEKTGEWSVAHDNNFVKNGSFEADRKAIPSHVKPVQTELTGWVTQVIGGNKVSLDSNSSPVLNHANTTEERKIVIGERSLHISDKVAFERKVSQVISSTDFVELRNGFYTLTAKVRSMGNFSKLEMFAETNRKIKKFQIKNNTSWTTIRIGKIAVKNGSIEIGFIAKGAANAHCYVDDITLIKSR